MINKYSGIIWYCEENAKIVGVFDGNLEKKGENLVRVYFSNKLFDNVDFAAKFENSEKKGFEAWIGNEAKYGKTIIKAKASDKGNFAVGFHKKVLPRTKLNLSAEGSLSTFPNFRIGAYCNFHSKSIK